MNAAEIRDLFYLLYTNNQLLNTGLEYKGLDFIPMDPVFLAAARNGLCVNTECILHRKPFNLRRVLCLTSADGYS